MVWAEWDIKFPMTKEYRIGERIHWLQKKLTPFIAYGLLGLTALLVATRSSTLPILRHDVFNGQPCEVDFMTSSGFFGAEQYQNKHLEPIEWLHIQGNELEMRTMIQNMLHIIIAQYGGTIESMQKKLENLYPDCHVVVTKIITSGNNISKPDANISDIADKIEYFIVTDNSQSPEAIQIFIPNFQTDQGIQVEKQRQSLTTVMKQRLNGNTHAFVSKDISKYVVYDDKGFNRDFLVPDANEKRMHLASGPQENWFMLVTDPDPETFK